MAEASIQGQQMLAGYFEDLLAEPELEVVQVEAEPVAETPELAAETTPKTGTVTQTDTEIPAPAQPVADDDAATAADHDLPDPEVVTPVAETSQRPVLNLETPPAMAHWRDAQQHDCLILQLNGLRLAMPLCCADLPKPWPEGVVVWNEGWFQGRYAVDDATRVVVHLAEIIMPGKGIPHREGIVVPLLELPWSLRVDDLEGSRRFAATDISWNTQATKRPWLAGMVKGQPLAVIDPLELAKMLAHAWNE